MAGSELDRIAPHTGAAEASAAHPLVHGGFAIGTERAPWRRLALAFGALLSVAALGLAAYYARGVGSREQSVESSRTQAASTPRTTPQPVTVAVTELQMTLIKTGSVAARAFRAERTAVGQIALNEDLTTPIFAPYAGRVTRLFAKPGDQVKPGDLLFEIDSPDLVQAEATLIAAAATAQKARSQLELTGRALARQRELYAVKAVAQKELEQAEADQRGADSDVRGASGALAAARDALRLFGKTDAEIKRIEDERRTDPIMPVRAPLGGTVVTRKAGPGQYVQPSNSDPVVVIADLSRLWLVANVAEMEIPFIHLDDEVEVKVAAYPGEVFRARITNIGAVVDPSTRRLTVRAELEPKGYQLKPQMFATFRIVTDTGAPSPAVPITAVLRDGDQSSVWMQVAPRTFAPRRIERGIEQGGMIQVLTGVAAGETVVVEGAIFLGNAQAAGGK